jgi:hypothetical protein
VKFDGFFDPMLDAQIVADFYGSEESKTRQSNCLKDRAHGQEA